MHAGRTKAQEAQTAAAMALLERWRRSKTFYASPFGSNDDWCTSWPTTGADVRCCPHAHALRYASSVRFASLPCVAHHMAYYICLISLEPGL